MEVLLARSSGFVQAPLIHVETPDMNESFLQTQAKSPALQPGTFVIEPAHVN